MDKKFLVTGGLGFIGSHLVEYLLKCDYEVIVVDDLSTGKIENIATPESQKFKIIISKIQEVDISSFGKLDAIFHLAAQASVPISVENLYLSSMNNLGSSLKLIDQASKLKIPLIYASSSAIYGNLNYGLEYSDVELLTPYAVDKYVVELYCNMALKLYGLRSYGLRFFNVYGPRQDPKNPYSGVISIFSDRILNGQNIVINGGHQTRDFVYVEDVVKAIWSSFLYLQNNAVSTYSNVLTGQSISIDELANLMIELIGITVDKTYRDLSFGDPEISLGSTKIMQRELNLNNFAPINEGLSKTISFMSSIK
jgi:UDP-glucose 4-epimerase